MEIFLTKREIETLKLIHLPTVEIAKKLGISPNTARSYIEQLRDKFNCSTRVQILCAALKASLIEIKDIP